MNFSPDKEGLVKLFAGVLAAVGLFTVSFAFAVGTTERERTMSRYANCEWTDAMSKQIYECVKRNNGFGTHWCFDETLQLNCEPEPLPGDADQSAAKEVAAPAAAAAAAVADKTVTQEEARQRAARQGEENLQGTTEREQTMVKYKDCKWTDEMGKYTYECVKRNNGFGTHWCYDEALQTFCPAPNAEPKS